MAYFGPVTLEDQPKRWASRHDSFASEAWIIAQVKWGPWQWCGKGQFIITTTAWEGNKTVKVRLKAQCYWERRSKIPSSVKVIHAHLL